LVTKSEWTYQHLMSVNGKFKEIGREDLMLEADRFGVSRPGDLLKDVRAALESWATFSREAGLSSSASGRVAADFCLLG
jgi:serine/threonine-protein kinase HipA